MRWRVLIPLPVGGFDFRPPHDWREPPGSAAGRRVLVPWQGGVRVGVVAGESESRPGEGSLLRETIAVLDERPLLTRDALDTLLAIAQFTLAPEGIALGDLMPFGLEPAISHRVRLVPGVDLTTLPPFAPGLLEWVPAARQDPTHLDFLRDQGLLEERAEVIQPTREVIRPLAVVGEARKTLTAKQRAALDALEAAGQVESVAALARLAGVSPAVAGALTRSGVARVVREPLPAPDLRLPPAASPAAPVGVTLPAGDARLHGGRPRERHATLAALIRRAAGSVLYLAPDHATLERAWAALAGVRPSVLLHGELSAREREEAWRRARDGEAEVVFGTVLALLAPLPDLALVIVEEEGSDAFKLQGGTRLFVPDGARTRAHQAGARLILTGSVPAVESMPLPGVVLDPPRSRLHVIDYAAREDPPEVGPLSLAPSAGLGWPLSNELKRLLRQVAERGRQAVLITPRRGYSAVLRCSDCGWVPYCPNCDVPLRLHAERGRLQCHQCGYDSRAPEECPACHGSVLAPRGPGSEWVAAELRRLLPQTPIYRFDRDRRDDLAPLAAGEPGVVAGTSAVLSLPAPPDLALVALTFADTFVTHSDFRAGERFHTLLRRLLEWHPTRAPLTIVQTFLAGHPALNAVIEGRAADAYPRHELHSRERLGYPPFALLAQVQVAARRAPDAERAAEHLAALVRDRGAGPHDLLGPAPAPIPRIKGLFAYHMLVRAADAPRLARLLEPARNYRGSARVRVDVNPREFSDLLE